MNKPMIKLCGQYDNGKVLAVYPDWVVEKASDSFEDSESDSEFQNLFKMIQRNEYSTHSEKSNPESEVESVKSVRESHKEMHFKDNETGKPKKMLTRPTLFMKPLTKATEEPSRKSVSKRTGRYSMGIGTDGITAMKLLIMQKGLSDSVEPEYRKKDRVALGIRNTDFNLCHKSFVKNISDRVKNVLHKNYCYINDRDIAEKLEVKIEKIFQARIAEKKHALRDHWKSKDPIPEYHKMVDRQKSVQSVQLISQLDFSMPHRKFQNDINKFVKRLRELADYFSRKTSGIYFKKDDSSFERNESRESFINEFISEYRLIPTFETFNQRFVKVNVVQERMHNDEETDADNNYTTDDDDYANAEDDGENDDDDNYFDNDSDKTDTIDKIYSKNVDKSNEAFSMGFGIPNLRMKESDITEIMEDNPINFSTSSLFNLKFLNNVIP